MAADDELPPAVKLGALKDALDRAGLSPRQAFDVTHELKPYEQTLQRLERGPRPGREAEPEIIDAEIVDESSAAPACAGCGAQFPAELPPHLDAYPEFCRDCRDAGLDSAPASSGAPSDETRESSGPVPESGPRYSGEEARSGPLPGRGYPSPDEARQARTRTARDPGDAPGAGEHGYVTAEEGARLAARDYRRPRPRKRRV
ncbi:MULTISPECIES: hypothetical protein [unclassified Pseudonocardia]|uniref:hypothetical protein n=1 Tax=unclassified Pseudonocardia TaxID=2619320 RepID=UPI00111527E2|nr:hypothetical protein [Pseudonocardia sp. Ae707_Ps1]